MMLHIGKVGRSRFLLPVDIATQAMAIHGVRGKGKTVTASVIVEELLTIGIQVVVLDPTDSWWGLKSTADGLGAGHPIVILGGEHGDLPLQAESGHLIADFAVEKRVSMILSLRHLRKNAQRRFVTDFAEQLYHRKGEAKHRVPLFLAIDEASQYVPQRVMGDTARMVGAIQDIVRMGRSAGLGVALIDQRPATVNKDVLSQIELMVCHAVTSPQDRKALGEWVSQKDSEGREKEFMADLASLERGEAWFWMPITDLFERVRVRMRNTFDSSKTPEVGKAAVAPKKLATVDLEALRGALEETIAEAEANDPAILQRRIRELEAEIQNAPPTGPSEEEIAESIRCSVDRELVTALAHLRKRFVAAIGPVASTAERVAGTVEQLVGSVNELHELFTDDETEAEAMYAAERAVVVPIGRVPAQRAPKTPPHPVMLHDGLVPRQQGILNVLGGFEALGLKEVSRGAVAVMSDQSPKSSAYDKHLRRLKNELALIRYPRPGWITLTEEGRGIADRVAIPTTLMELHSAWAGKLSPPQARMLWSLVAAYPGSLTRPLLAEDTNQSVRSSAFDKHVRTLRSLQIVDYPETGSVVATALLFPTGLK